MWGLVGRRLLHGAVIVWLVASLTFVLLHLAPGDPFTASLGERRVPAAVRADWCRRLGCDRPIGAQYLLYLRGAMHGDFGWSVPHQQPVGALLAQRLPNTLVLMGAALAVAFALGILLGVVQAARRGRATDAAITAGSLFFYSMPEFWLALMLLSVFALRLGVLPATGMFDPVMYPYLGFWGRLGDRLRHLVLPATALVLVVAALVARFQRGAMLEVAGQEFVRTARAKGVGERRIVGHHILRNALLPTITLLGFAIPWLLGGAVFVEQVFSWPGMGMLVVESIGSRDYPTLTAAAVVASATVVVGSLVADLLTAAADPRVRLA